TLRRRRKGKRAFGLAHVGTLDLKSGGPVGCGRYLRPIDMPTAITRRSLLARVAASASLTTACTTMSHSFAPSIVYAVTPTGRLRASINLGNPILANKDASGQPVGVSIDLARAFAKQLGVECELVVFDTAGKSVDAVKAEQADIGFFAIDPLRGEGIRFTAPYVLIEGAYLVKNASPLKDNAEVDRAGTRVMVGKGSAYDLYLTRALKAAQILRAPTSPAVVDAFIAENADV